MRLASCLILVIAIVIGGCSSKEKEIQRILDSPISYEAYVSPWAEMSRYKTWDWVVGPENTAEDARASEAEMRKAIEEAITGQMDARGYKKTSDSPDLALNYHVVTQKIDKDYIKKMYDGSYYPEYRMDFSGPRSAWKKWEEGSLIVFAFDTASRQMAWRGAAVAEITDEAPLDRRIERVNKAVKWMFTSLPGRPRWEENYSPVE